MPIVDSLVELVQLAIEKKKGKYALEIAKMNKEVSELNSPSELESTCVIGFQAPDNEIEEELEEDVDF